MIVQMNKSRTITEFETLYVLDILKVFMNKRLASPERTWVPKQIFTI